MYILSIEKHFINLSIILSYQKITFQTIPGFDQVFLVKIMLRQYSILKDYFLLIGLFLVIGCTTPQQEVKRPTEPWVFRSVLDYRPRMLTLALDPECYLAYDLNHCGLYRAWKGGVNWDGIVYNEIKSMQPSCWGKDYVLQKSLSGIWTLQISGERKTPKVKFRGYRLKNEQIYLSYQLTTENDTIEIVERPEFVRNNQGMPGIERQFTTRGMGKDVAVFLSTPTETLELKRNTETVFKNFYEPIPEQTQTDNLVKSNDRGRYWIEKSDCFTCHDWKEKMVGPGFQQIAEKYSNDEEVVTELAQRVKNGGSGVWGQAAMNPHPDLGIEDVKTMVSYILSLSDKTEGKKKAKPKPAKASTPAEPETKPKPGHGAPLEDVHPSFDVSTIRSPNIEFKIGGLAFMPDGRLVVATWTPHGSVYILDSLQDGDINTITTKLIAQGLAEPLGVEVVNGDIFVLQKQELTQLIDHNGDEVIDEYKSFCNGFGVSADFHEFAFGLVHKDGHFYANLSLPLRLMTNEKPHADRGKTIKIAMDGSFEYVNHGLREPNGIGIGMDDQLFITDNQGQWLPANKLIHVRQGDFHGMRWGLPDSLSDIKMVPPTVWLPEDEIANSPSEPSLMKDGPYAGQMMFGDVSHGGIKRAFLEKINGTYQGVVFRFTQGLEAGINRIRRGPSGAIYVGGVGMAGGWGWQGKKSGLQQMKYNGKTTFEILAIRAKPNGFEIEFTEPLSDGHGSTPSDYRVEQWWYLPTPAYGGPKMDLENLSIAEVKVSADRKTVFLDIPNLKKEHVIKFDLNQETKSSTGQALWSSEAWYTLNNIP